MPRPPRGVPKEEFASRDYYDVCFPNLAPSLETMKQAQAAETAKEWAGFERKCRMATARSGSRNASVVGCEKGTEVAAAPA